MRALTDHQVDDEAQQIELCGEGDSVLSSEVPPGVLAVRITLGGDLTNKETKAAIHEVIREAFLLNFHVYLVPSAYFALPVCPCLFCVLLSASCRSALF